MTNKALTIGKDVDQKVAAFVDSATDIWKERDEIRKIFAPTLTDSEFKFFVAMGITLHANPFLKEIYAVKFGKGDKASPAQIIVARNLYRRKAQEIEDYSGHIPEAVYPGEDFELVRDDKDRIIGVKHTPEMELRYADTETLPYGAYCVVYKKSTDIPVYVFVPFREYHMTNAKKEYVNDQPTGKRIKNDFWANKPETMIKKVAEAQALRAAFQGTFGGTYIADEFDLDPDLEVRPPVREPKKVPPFKKMIKAIKGGKIKEVLETINDYEWKPEQREELDKLIQLHSSESITKEEKPDDASKSQSEVESKDSVQSESDEQDSTAAEAARDEKIEHLKQLAANKAVDLTTFTKGYDYKKMMAMDADVFETLYASLARGV